MQVDHEHENDGNKKRKKREYAWIDKASGKPLEHDPNFKGPIEKRSCTDVLCIFGFAAFIAVWGVLSFFAVKYGDPEKLIHPTDSKGRLCGVNKPGGYNLTGKPYLLFFDLTKCASYSTAFEGCPTPQICVAACPGYYFSYLVMKADALPIPAAEKEKLFANLTRTRLICLDEVDKNELTDFATIEKEVKAKRCADYVVASRPMLGRCIPEVLLDGGDLARMAADKLNNDSSATSRLLNETMSSLPNSTGVAQAKDFVNWLLNARAVSEKVIADLEASWWQICACLVLAAVLALVWILMMRCMSGPMVWLSIVLLTTVLAGGAGFCWYKFYLLKQAGAINDYYVTTNIKLYFEMPRTFLVCGVVLSVALLILILLLIYLRTRIAVAIALIEESSKAVTHMISALFFPILPFVLQGIAFIFWGSVAVYLASWSRENCRRVNATLADISNETDTSHSIYGRLILGESDTLNATTVNFSSCPCASVDSFEDPTCRFINFTKDEKYVFYFQAFNLFGFFWAICFIESLAHLTLAGAFASYYWAFRKPEDVPLMPVLKGFYRAVRYHLGSLAFGSLILAIVKYIRAVLEYLDEKLKKSENPIAKYAMMCLKCCFWCLEKCLRFMTKNAFIMMAIHGNNFCISAKDSFLLLMRNIVRVFVIDTVTDFLLFIGKLAVTGAICVFSFYFFSGKLGEGIDDPHFSMELNYYFLPILVVAIGSYVICCAFFGVYDMAVDTTFLCFLEDSERNDGTPEKPFFMSKELMKILNKENTFTASYL